MAETNERKEAEQCPVDSALLLLLLAGTFINQTVHWWSCHMIDMVTQRTLKHFAVHSHLGNVQMKQTGEDSG